MPCQRRKRRRGDWTSRCLAWRGRDGDGYDDGAGGKGRVARQDKGRSAFSATRMGGVAGTGKEAGWKWEGSGADGIGCSSVLVHSHTFCERGVRLHAALRVHRIVKTDSVPEYVGCVEVTLPYFLSRTERAARFPPHVSPVSRWMPGWGFCLKYEVRLCRTELTRSEWRCWRDGPITHMIGAAPQGAQTACGESVFPVT